MGDGFIDPLRMLDEWMGGWIGGKIKFRDCLVKFKKEGKLSLKSQTKICSSIKNYIIH
jgi:hypothetical protein